VEQEQPTSLSPIYAIFFSQVHAVRIHGMEKPPNYSNAWVQTSRFIAEKREGWPFMPKVKHVFEENVWHIHENAVHLLFSLFPLQLFRLYLQDNNINCYNEFLTQSGDLMGARAMGVGPLTVLYLVARLFRFRDGMQTANISVTYHSGRLMANHEQDLPYLLCMKEGEGVKTLGRRKFGSKGIGGAFSAHPKIDPETGMAQLHAFSLDPGAMAKPGSCSLSICVAVPS